MFVFRNRHAVALSLGFPRGVGSSNWPLSGTRSSAPKLPKRLAAMTALAAERKFFDRRTGRRPGASMIGRPSAVVRSHCTRFCPAATNRFAAITAFAALRKWRPALETSPPPLWPPPPPKIFISAAPAPGGGGSCGFRGRTGVCPPVCPARASTPRGWKGSRTSSRVSRCSGASSCAETAASRRGRGRVRSRSPIPDPRVRSPCRRRRPRRPFAPARVHPPGWRCVLGRRLAAARSARSARVHRVGPPIDDPFGPIPSADPAGERSAGVRIDGEYAPGTPREMSGAAPFAAQGSEASRGPKSSEASGPQGSRPRLGPGGGPSPKPRSRPPRTPPPPRTSASAAGPAATSPCRRGGSNRRAPGPSRRGRTRPPRRSAPSRGPLAPARAAPPPGCPRCVPRGRHGRGPGRAELRPPRPENVSSARLFEFERRRRRRRSGVWRWRRDRRGGSDAAPQLLRVEAPQPPTAPSLPESLYDEDTPPEDAAASAPPPPPPRGTGTPPRTSTAACAEYSDDAEYSVASESAADPTTRRTTRRPSHRSHRRVPPPCAPRATARTPPPGPVLPGERVVRARDRGGGDVPAPNVAPPPAPPPPPPRPRAHRAVLPRDHEQLRKAPRARTGRALCPGQGAGDARARDEHRLHPEGVRHGDHAPRRGATTRRRRRRVLFGTPPGTVAAIPARSPRGRGRRRSCTLDEDAPRSDVRASAESRRRRGRRRPAVAHPTCARRRSRRPRQSKPKAHRAQAREPPGEVREEGVRLRPAKVRVRVAHHHARAGQRPPPPLGVRRRGRAIQRIAPREDAGEDHAVRAGEGRGEPAPPDPGGARLGASSEAEETISRMRIVSCEGGRRGAERSASREGPGRARPRRLGGPRGRGADERRTGTRRDAGGARTCS